jgi:hypothetical protein
MIALPMEYLQKKNRPKRNHTLGAVRSYPPKQRNHFSNAENFHNRGNPETFPPGVSEGG